MCVRHNSLISKSLQLVSSSLYVCVFRPAAYPPPLFSYNICIGQTRFVLVIIVLLVIIRVYAGARGSLLAEGLCYKPDGHGFQKIR
jgi:hypothetical protein